jgi:putative methionine-R-sulfoxide reductase with GAF domain
VAGQNHDRGPDPDADPPDRADDAALADSLAGLDALSTGTLDLTEMLTQVATLAVRAIPGADGAGLTLLEIDRADLIVKSEPFVRAIDEIQYGIGEGPCISAAASGETKRSGQLGEDQRWPQFGPRAGELGVHSALSLPLLVSTGVIGAMNVYAHAPNSFDERAQQLGEQYAVSAALAVQNAQILEQASRLVGQLQAGVEGRAKVDQAIGVLRRRHGLTADQALIQLKELSQNREISLNATASSVVAEAVKRSAQRSQSAAEPDPGAANAPGSE